MFTLGLIYIFTYILIFLSLFYISFTRTPFQLLTKLSISSYLLFIQKYTNIKNLFFFLIFSLTGLPPVGLFFIKFNILVFIIYQTHIVIIIFLFLIFLCNMLYYIQIFNIKNFKSGTYSLITPNIVTNWNSESRGFYSSYSLYVYTNAIVIVIGFIATTILIYTDFFFLMSL